jgi:ribosome-binding protein aMBF1 (putative translation factor)
MNDATKKMMMKKMKTKRGEAPPSTLSPELQMFYERIGGRIAKLRERRGLSLRDLAAITGVSAATIGYMERGRAQTAFHAYVFIAVALDVSLHDLVNG